MIGIDVHGKESRMEIIWTDTMTRLKTIVIMMEMMARTKKKMMMMMINECRFVGASCDTRDLYLCFDLI